jgi:hypothetical protein
MRWLGSLHADKSSGFVKQHFQERHYLGNGPYLTAQPGFHRRRDAERLMYAPEVVPHIEQGNHVADYYFATGDLCNWGRGLDRLRQEVSSAVSRSTGMTRAVSSKS